MTAKVVNTSKCDVLANFRNRTYEVFLISDGLAQLSSASDLPLYQFRSQHDPLPLPPKDLAQNEYSTDHIAAKFMSQDSYTFSFREPGLYRIVGTWASEEVSPGRFRGMFVGELRSNMVSVQVEDEEKR